MFHETYELIIAGLGAIVAIIVASVAIIHTSLLKKEFDTINRPWVGSDDDTFVNDNKDRRILFHYTNHGNIVATSLVEKMGVSLTPITREQIPQLTSEATYTGALVFPKQKRRFTSNYNESVISQSIKENKPVFYWATIDYNYLKNKKGKYGIICSFLNTTLDIKDEWSN